ncbi:MAG: DegT/DnrJ/EryC1/StrS family aminotransferase [Thermoplasmata archaeon]|nr:DegT/DnrJ/EryC1/StrS family aminotransferase [Thermoplasmata archaeon]
MPSRVPPRRIPVYTPSFGPEEGRLVARAVRGGWITSDGPFVDEFETKFSRYAGGKYGIATTNGTAALHLALAALRVGPGDEVILPDATMVACLDAVLYTGATPVFVDVDPSHWALDPDLTEAAITSRTRAVMPVDIYGHPAEMDRFARLGRQYRIGIVEDAAEAHGSEFRGHRVGAMGDMGCFSFYANKILTTGEGGMVVTRRTDLAERMGTLRELAYASASRNYHHTEVGFNYRLTDLQCAVGLAQLGKMKQFVRHRRECRKVYEEVLGGIDGVTLQGEAPWARSAYWVNTILIDAGPARRQLVQEALAKQGIGSRVAFWPMHRQPFAPASTRRSKAFPISDRLGNQGLSLPSGNGISLATVRRVATAVRHAL